MQPTTSNFALTPASRERLLHSLRRRIESAQREGDLLLPPDAAAALLSTIESHLDALVTIAQSATAEREEPYFALILEQICPHCPFQTQSGYCPQRFSGQCLLFRHARLIIQMIDDAMKELTAQADPHLQKAVGEPDLAFAGSTTLFRPAFRRILIAIDRSEPAEFAARAGMILAEKLGGCVLLVHVVPTTLVDVLPVHRDEDQAQSVAALFTHCRAELPANVACEDQVLQGRPAAEIIRAARDWAADLVVVGTHNRHGLSRFALGSTAQSVLQHAPCPVLIVRHSDDAERERAMAYVRDTTMHWQRDSQEATTIDRPLAERKMYAAHD